MLEFEWDEEKARSNLRKHGVSFDDAVLAFDDLFSFHGGEQVVEHGEVRYMLLGLMSRSLLAVVYTHRGDVVRIISARRANKYEQRLYAQSRQV